MGKPHPRVLIGVGSMAIVNSKLSSENEDFHCLEDLSLAPSSPRTMKDMRLLPQRHGWHAMCARQTGDLRENLSDLLAPNPRTEPGKAGITRDVHKKENAIVCI